MLPVGAINQVGMGSAVMQVSMRAALRHGSAQLQTLARLTPRLTSIALMVVAAHTLRAPVLQVPRLRMAAKARMIMRQAVLKKEEAWHREG